MNGGERKRERRKLVDLVESRVDAEVAGELSGWLLSQRVVYVYDIPLTSPGRGPGQLAPMCCRFQGFPSI